TKTLFSVNAAAILLEKDRATLVRALRRVPADGTERGQPRWKLPTIISALAVRPEARRESGLYRDRYNLYSPVLDGMRREYEKQVALISAEPSPDRCRAMAVALAPLLRDYQVAYRDVGRSLHMDDD